LTGTIFFSQPFLRKYFFGCSQQDNTQRKGNGSDTQQPNTATTSSARDNGARLALLIGNDKYDKNANMLKLGALDNPVNDAIDMT
jgi:hypothetical protein